MAIIRISGGHDGIVEYLRTGQKVDRYLSREQLDERVALIGDLDVTDTLLKTMNTPGQKFLHVTIAFKEDWLPITLLRKVAQDFEKFAFSAYTRSEYNLYAEAHLPRTKSALNQSDGSDVARLPHLHFVIPQVNLLTGRRLDPFGLTARCINYIDAFQESLNHQYGLASPKENVRVQTTDRMKLYGRMSDHRPGRVHETKAKIFDAVMSKQLYGMTSFSELLAASGVAKIHRSGHEDEYCSVLPTGSKTRVRLNEDVFSRRFLALPPSQKQEFVAARYAGERRSNDDSERQFSECIEACKRGFSAPLVDRKDIKNQILQEVIERDIGSVAEFRSMLSAFGETRTRNIGRRNEYENVRPIGWDRGINLKDFCFSAAFFRLSKSEKLELLERPVSSHYLDVGVPRQTSEELLAMLDEWRRIGARERKFINSGNRRLWSQYRRATDDEKIAMLDVREQKYNARLRSLAPNTERASRPARPDQRLRTTEKSPEIARASTPVIVAGPGSSRNDSLIGRLAADAVARRNAEEPDIAEIKRSLDANRLLSRLTQSHGLVGQKYTVVSWSDGSDRIRCGSRHYPVNDFLTVELHLPWREAESILRDEYRLQTMEIAACPFRQPPTSRLWQEFVRAHPPVAPSKRKMALADQQLCEARLKVELEQQHHQKVTAVLKTPGGLTDELTWVLFELRAAREKNRSRLQQKIEKDRDDLRFELHQRSLQHYRAWLIRLAEMDASALAELRLLATRRPENTPSVLAIEGELLVDAVLNLAQYEHRVLDDGQVFYSREGIDRFVDSDFRIHVTSAEEIDVESALRLALVKFGHRLELSGSDDFLMLAAEVAGRANLLVELEPPWINNVMASRRSDLDNPEGLAQQQVLESTEEDAVTHIRLNR